MRNSKELKNNNISNKELPKNKTPKNPDVTQLSGVSF